jgi:hypothetical protein
MNIDQLIRDADPAGEFAVPGSDSPVARQSFERMLAARSRQSRTRRRRITISVAGAAVAALGAAITLITSITPVVPVSPAAAAILNQAAVAASHQKPIVLPPGDYFYTMTRGFGIVMTEWKPRMIYYPEYVSTDQSWLTANGNGKDIYTIVSPITFAHGTRDIWIAAGKPAIYSQNPTITTGDEVPLVNLSHLPARPAALARQISHKRTGLADINADIEDPSSPTGLFRAALEILSTKSVGGTPALRSALFNLMAQQPGIKDLGTTKTRSGQSGIGLETSPDRTGTVIRTIISATNGQVLETDQYTHGYLDTWTDYLGSGIVKHIGQVPGS